MKPDMTEQAFTATVKERASRLGFIQALYKTLDEYQAVERETAGNPACTRGCSVCCLQMVAVFPVEMDAINSYIKKQASPVRKKLRERARPLLEKWQDWYRNHRLLAPQQMLDPILLAKNWLGQRCPLLQEDGSWGVYEARPLVCRVTASPTRCTELVHIEDNQHAVQMRLQSEKWANELLMKYLGEHGGSVAATPLHHFLCIKAYRL